MSDTRDLNRSQRPVGPPMRGREAIEFLVTVAGLQVRRLERSGQPSNVASVNHVAGLCYELCRFVQAAGSFYEKLSKDAVRNPQVLERHLEPVRYLIAAIAEGCYVPPIQTQF